MNARQIIQSTLDAGKVQYPDKANWADLQTRLDSIPDDESDDANKGALMALGGMIHATFMRAIQGG
jgi:hypothetical protein